MDNKQIQELEVFELFDLILENDNLTNTKIYNIIEVKTNLEPIRLELLICDIQSYLFTNDEDTYMNYNDTNLYLHKYAPLYSIWELLKKMLNNKSQLKQIKHPFKDNETLELFNHIVENWNYDKGQKWADIYTYLDDLFAYEMPEKKDYRKYIILKYQYTGKFQYNIISNKNYDALYRLVGDSTQK